MEIEVRRYGRPQMVSERPRSRRRRYAPILLAILAAALAWAFIAFALGAWLT